MTPHGIVIVDKPAGITSHDVVDKIRRIFRTKRVGHTGTLDPEATGVLAICIGNGTRLAEYLSCSEKRYLAEVTFGIETNTQDIWGDTIAETDASHITAADLQQALSAFRGRIEQIPPMVSARRHEGKHLYELARKGVTVEREARPVEILLLEATEFRLVDGNHPTCRLEVICSTGTYISTLAHDIGQALRVGAAMSALRRTHVGSIDRGFHLEQAHTLEQLQEIATNGADALRAAVLPLSVAVADWPSATLDDGQEQRIRHGHTVLVSETELTIEQLNASTKPIALLRPDNTLIAVARLRDESLQPVKVMAD